MSDHPQPEPFGDCSERSRILDLYGAAVKHYTNVGRDVAACAVSYEADLFNNAWTICQAAYQECKRLREELRRHMNEHRC
jgi:hypothetical protein